MTKDNSMNALNGVIKILTPLSSEERTRVVRAALTMLGESQSTTSNTPESSSQSFQGLPARARAWLKQNSITPEQLQQIFDLSNGAVEIIAPEIPGKNKKEQTFSAYLLAGVGQLLLTGIGSFDDKSARALCERSGCYDLANHSAHLRDRGNEFTGSKERGWTLTTPGLRRAAEIIKDMTIS